ncbi:hypothetical protein [Phytohabitans kaempferiae]|uniref:DUF3558 domain-containing protein n=1 Tax=Phytohabitans kaempferiae TaxID=1620943 RepID=A0ABV6M1T3_9ACTN
MAFVLVLSLSVTGCGVIGGDGDAPPDGAGATAAPSPSASPTEEAGPLYALPSSADVCAAAKRSKLSVVGAEPEKEGLDVGCAVSVRSKQPDRPYTLRVRFEDWGNARRTRTFYQTQKDGDWYKGHSAFTGPPTQRSDVLQVGDAKPGAGYDEGYYAFYADVEVARVHYSQSVVGILKGNLIVTMDLLAGDQTSTSIASIKPVKAEVGQKMFDDVADAVLALPKER